MFGGAAGYAVMSLPTQHIWSSNPHDIQQHKEEQHQATSAFNKQQAPQYNHQEQQVPLVDVSLDLMQYMSDSFAGDAWVVPTMTTSQQPHAGTKGAGSLAACSSLMGSSCSSHSNQMVPDSPTCSSNSSQQQQQDDCNMVGSSSEDATAAAAAAAAATTTTSSDSGSSSSMMLQHTHPQPAAGSCLSYDDDFVFQCYYGNPSSPANQQQQRPKQRSPFAAYAYVPGFSV